jgi:hypothetical protein
MRITTLAISAIVAFALSAGLASAQMQPIPNPPDVPHHHGMMAHWHHHHHHHRGHHHH